MNTNNSPSKHRSGKIHPAIIGGGLLVVLLIGAFAFMAFGGRAHPDLPLEAYYDSPRSFAGNHYVIECRIDSQTDYHEGTGRMLIVRSLGDDAPLVVFSPESLAGFTPHSGQIYRLTVVIDGRGLAVINEFRKL